MAYGSVDGLLRNGRGALICNKCEHAILPTGMQIEIEYWWPDDRRYHIDCMPLEFLVNIMTSEGARVRQEFEDLQIREGTP